MEKVRSALWAITICLFLMMLILTVAKYHVFDLDSRLTVIEGRLLNE